MTIHRLAVFCSVVQKGGFSRAAQHLLISQPSVSAEIGALEKKYGVKLIDRSKSRKNAVVLTKAGEKVYVLANQILDSLDELERFTAQYRGKETRPPVVTILANSPSGTYLLPELLNEFKTSHPEYRIDVLIGTDYNSIVDAVQKNLYDIAIFPEPPAHFHAEFIFKETLTVVANQRFYRPQQVYNLEELPFILPPEDTPVRRILDRHLSKKGIQLNVMLNLSHPDSIKNTVKLGVGVAILSSVCVKNDLNKEELIEIRVSEEMPAIHYSVIRPTQRPMTEHASQVIKFLQHKLT